MHDQRNRQVRAFLNNRSAFFWALQVAGWAGISVVSYFSLNLWYNQPEVEYLLHNFAQSIAGILISWPMRPIYRNLWDRSLPVRIAVSLLVVLLLSLVWAAARLLLFLALTEESGLWKDFGGWYFPSIFIFFCWTSVYYGIKYYQLFQEEHSIMLQIASDKQQESLRRSQAESTARAAQLEMLQYQLNPHFLFNTLNSISSLVVANRNAEGNKMILQLSDFLRHSLTCDPKKEITLAEEIDTLQLYFQIEQTRFHDKLKIEVAVDEHACRCMVPGLILQPLAENAIKYAISVSESGGVIRIAGSPVGDQLVISVDDSGPGFTSAAEKPRGGTGVGLRNISDRLEAMYGRDFKLTKGDSELGGARVEIRLPAHRKGQVND